MSALIDHPAFQGGIAPFVVALIVAAVLCRSRLAWLAIVAGYATAIGLTAGFAFSPLTALRKIVLVSLLAPLVGLAADSLLRTSRGVVVLVAVAFAAASIWVFASVLAQRESGGRYLLAGGVALFVALIVALVERLRSAGLRAGACGIGLGLATALSAFLSASIGFMLDGAAVAAAAAALLLVQVIASERPAGHTGALSIAAPTGLFAAGSLMLAQLPWYALPALLIVPAAALLPVPERAPRVARAALLFLYTVCAAMIPVLAAWFGARGSFA